MGCQELDMTGQLSSNKRAHRSCVCLLSDGSCRTVNYCIMKEDSGINTSIPIYVLASLVQHTKNPALFILFELQLH